MSIGKCSRESQINVRTNIKEKVMITQSQDHGFQGKNACVSAGEGMKMQGAEMDRRRNSFNQI